MKTDLAPNRSRRTADEVIADVNECIPHVAQHMFTDRDWIWYCGPSLQGEHNRSTREELKLIGFRFCPNGHVMQDGVTVGSWSHSCTHPIARWRKPTEKRATLRQKEPTQDYAKLFADLGL